MNEDFLFCPCSESVGVVELLEAELIEDPGCVCAEYGCEGRPVDEADVRMASLVRAGAWALVDALREGVVLEAPMGAAKAVVAGVERRRLVLQRMVAGYRELGCESLALENEARLAELPADPVPLPALPVEAWVSLGALVSQLGVVPADGEGCCRESGWPAGASAGPVRLERAPGGWSVSMVLGSAEGPVVVRDVAFVA
jgi:hypothetical protein